MAHMMVAQYRLLRARLVHANVAIRTFSQLNFAGLRMDDVSRS